MNSPYLCYSKLALDRAVTQREDADWIQSQRQHPDCRIAPLWRNRNLVADFGDSAKTPRLAFIPPASASVGELVFLGLDRGAPVFTTDLSALDEAAAQSLAGPHQFVDMRQVGPLMSVEDAALGAFARGILYWHRRHRFCGKCGSPSVSKRGGHMRLCQNHECAVENYPRTDPAVIMLVEHRPTDGGPVRCLLGRHVKMPPGSYSTLAGFVDPGETLEEAVAREVFEEAGVRVDSVAYMASQPWPFPSSIMLGFRANALTTQIEVDPNELAEAGWFTAEQVRNAGNWGDSEATLRLPRVDSISRYLIDSWADSVVD